VNLIFGKQLFQTLPWMSEKDTILALPSNPENIAHVEPLVGKVAEKFNLSADQQDNILLSLTEAVVNAIVHGNRGDISKNVRISLRKNKSSLAFRVSDEGKGFDPRQLQDPTAPDRIEECGGRGVFLMQQLSDNCRFMNGGRTVEMKWKI
jgi:serine/threonine-protein kinase RsbW